MFQKRDGIVAAALVHHHLAVFADHACIVGGDQHQLRQRMRRTAKIALLAQGFRFGQFVRQIGFQGFGVERRIGFVRIVFRGGRLGVIALRGFVRLVRSEQAETGCRTR